MCVGMVNIVQMCRRVYVVTDYAHDCAHVVTDYAHVVTDYAHVVTDYAHDCTHVITDYAHVVTDMHMTVHMW